MVLVALESWKGTHLKYRLGGLIPVLITYNLWEGKIKSLHFFFKYLFICLHRVLVAAHGIFSCNI